MRAVDIWEIQFTHIFGTFSGGTKKLGSSGIISGMPTDVVCASSKGDFFRRVRLPEWWCRALSVSVPENNTEAACLFKPCLCAN